MSTIRKNHPMPEILKGYVCPSYEDCSLCPFVKTDCIVHSKAGRK